VTEGTPAAPAHGLPVSPHCRVIVDHDYQGDPDGLVALDAMRPLLDHGAARAGHHRPWSA